MTYEDIIGQELISERLQKMVRDGRVPQALLLVGQPGAKTLPLALMLARTLLCEHGADGKPCEACHSCSMTREWVHPDMHFSFPILKKGSEHPVCDDYLKEFRATLLENPWMEKEDWMKALKAQNQQLTIYVHESDNLQRKLTLQASEGGRRVVLIWLPERMMEQTANKLLKIIEEPPLHTHFILVTEDAEHVLGTIRSRCQRIDVPALTRESGSADERLFFDLFVQLMRLAYQRRIKDLKAWSDTVAELGREKQKAMLEYFQHLMRENFIYNLHREELNNLTDEESLFSQNFARFITEKNIIPITEELTQAQEDIQQNTNAKMVFFDFAVKMIVMLIPK